ncbi:hypothetical protein OkiPb01551_08420 [Bordetella pertussis]|nr:hypothetical protein BPJ_13120 [Bordetella pertussis]BDT07312.1 hypothetical protein BP3J_10160 [Bordetella pertussis]CPL69383.1 Uncharacterised protein [Bordetella pertussis]
MDVSDWAGGTAVGRVTEAIVVCMEVPVRKSVEEGQAGRLAGCKSIRCEGNRYAWTNGPGCVAGGSSVFSDHKM